MMKRLMLIPGAVMLIAGAAEKVRQAPAAKALPALLSTLAPACGVRDANWGDWHLQNVATDALANTPYDGRGMFARPNPDYYDRSLGEVETAAMAGTILMERFGQPGCMLIDKPELAVADSAVALARRDEMHRMLPASGALNPDHERAAHAGWLVEGGILAGRCGIRNKAWLRDMEEAVDVEVQTAAGKEPDAPSREMAELMRIGAGSKIIGREIAALELANIREAACEWVRRPGSLNKLEAGIKEWRNVASRIRKGDLSGAGGIP